MDAGKLINIHSVIPFSRVNGSGPRLVIFLQGCKGECPDCFNPETHSFKEMNLLSAGEIFDKHLADGIEGITVSGGEPFAQPSGLLDILKTAKIDHALTTVVYTGFTYGALSEKKELKVLFDYIDVLIDGRYDSSKKETSLLARGSANQRFYFLSNRYTINDFYLPGKVEFTIGKDGLAAATGFSEIPRLAS